MLTTDDDVISSCDRALHVHVACSVARVEMSESSTGDREVPEGCKAQITHVIFDCDGLMLGRLVKLRYIIYITRHCCTKFTYNHYQLVGSGMMPIPDLSPLQNLNIAAPIRNAQKNVIMRLSMLCPTPQVGATWAQVRI